MYFKKGYIIKCFVPEFSLRKFSQSIHKSKSVKSKVSSTFARSLSRKMAMKSVFRLHVRSTFFFRRKSNLQENMSIMLSSLVLHFKISRLQELPTLPDFFLLEKHMSLMCEGFLLHGLQSWAKQSLSNK